MTVTVASVGDVPAQQFTYRPSADGPSEERAIRDIHPMTGQRLDLWRLKNFTGTRLPSAEGTFLFHLVAPGNPKDERLFAAAEVREALIAKGYSEEGLPAERTHDAIAEHRLGVGAPGRRLEAAARSPRSSRGWC